MIKQKYQFILEMCQPFVVANPLSLNQVNLSFIETTIQEQYKFNCLKPKSANFIQLIQNLDQLSFGNQSMAMDKWVIFDCAAMPGAICGFGIEKKELLKNDVDYLRQLKVPEDYEGLVPISFYMAIPSMQKNHWFGHNLSSMGSHLFNPLPGLGLLTKILAIDLLNIQWMYGATQWGSDAIFIHSKLASMKLLSSFTPAHTHAHSLCYLSEYSHDRLLKILKGETLEVCSWKLKVASNDLEMFKKLQNQIETGEEWSILTRPIVEQGQLFYLLG